MEINVSEGAYGTKTYFLQNINFLCGLLFANVPDIVLCNAKENCAIGKTKRYTKVTAYYVEKLHLSVVLDKPSGIDTILLLYRGCGM